MITSTYHPGEKIENEFLKEKIRSKINEMLKWKRRGFPGCNPVSLTNHNIKNLFTKEYLICEKTDGVRYFLFIASNTTFLIDRNYEIFKNDMHIPTIEDLSKKQQLTLLDGELVEDIIYNEKTGVEEKKIVYLIYDGLYIQRKDITNLSYFERLTNVYNYVITPLKKYKKSQKNKKNKNNLQTNHENESLYIELDEKDNIKKRKSNLNNMLTEEENNIGTNDNINSLNNCNLLLYKREEHREEKEYEEEEDERSYSSDDTASTIHEEEIPFEIYLKDFYPIEKICELIKIMKKLPHYSDGIIFTPLHSPYITGNFYQLLKWKPLNLNTVDFGIETIYDEYNIPSKFELFISINGVRTSYKCYLAEYGDVYKEFAIMFPKISSQFVKVKMVENKKVEGGWIAQKIRFDKNIPNDISTLNKVIQVYWIHYYRFINRRNIQK
ncbi:mRNA capping enzyme [Plasmodium falciparum RAJ116]|uniref:mRNA guanylyltransferase n=1 Tax=Plasmodium falciparum RAJ116 TaxID=580058 RepID=A0A0L0CZF8_PLAFA|nr:mRNA capping enzyme [Plasmodium falciparum RAJ116]